MKASRLAVLGTVIGMTVALGACAQGPGADPGTATTSAPPGGAQATGTPAPGEGANTGVTDVGDIYGPGCDQVPLQGEGSALGMVDDPVGTAASNNPLLSSLVQAVGAADLVDTLNDPNASFTVFAPANSAFESVPAATLSELMANPNQLRDILTYHVIPQRYDAAGLAAAGQVTTVQGKQLTITGEPGSLVIDEQERAKVLCGNIPTANATVFVIDRVLIPPAT
ncbi:MAG: fasciclin domain-containing protein [Pseudonocardiaceae bacterium]